MDRCEKEVCFIVLTVTKDIHIETRQEIRSRENGKGQRNNCGIQCRKL